MDCLERHLTLVNRGSIRFGYHSEWYKRHPRTKIAYGRPKCNMKKYIIVFENIFQLLMLVILG